MPKKYMSLLSVAVILFAGLVAETGFADGRLTAGSLGNENDVSQFVVRIEGVNLERLPVTDLQLDIVRWEGDVRDAVMQPNEPGRDPFSWNFYAALFVVADGRLFRDGGGECSAWENDLAVCSIECDGGHFVLRRSLGDTSRGLELQLRPLPELIDGDKSAAIRIGGCAEGDEILLDARSGKTARAVFSLPAE